MPLTQAMLWLEVADKYCCSYSLDDPDDPERQDVEDLDDEEEEEDDRTAELELIRQYADS